MVEWRWLYAGRFARGSVEALKFERMYVLHEVRKTVSVIRPDRLAEVFADYEGYKNIWRSKVPKRALA